MTSIQPTDGAGADERDVEMLAYARRLQAAVDESLGDEALLDRVTSFAGGVDGLLRFLADGMARAFDPGRACGETGLVQFAIDVGERTIELWLRIDADGCRSIEDGRDPDAIIAISLAVFLRIAFKRISGADAYVDGLVRASGDVVLATTLDDWFNPPDLAIASVIR